MGASSTQQVLGIIEQAKMMPAQVSGNIAMTPLVNPDAVGYREILSMDLALEMGDLDVTETGNVPNLGFSAQQPTLIRSGEAVLGGGNQDRIVRESRIVTGHERIDVYCIEAGRWRTQDENWMHTNTPVSLRRVVMQGADQQTVWNNVARILTQWGVQSSTNALGEIYSQLRRSFERRAYKFRWVEDQVGMIVTVDNKVAGVEYFGDKMRFTRDGVAILRDSYIPEAVGDIEGHISHEQVDASIDSFLSELRNGTRVAEAVFHQGDLIYATAV